MSSVVIPMPKIHETAIIHPNAVLGKNVEIGPYAVIDEEVVIGDNCKIGAHAVIHKYTTVGKNCKFFPGCSIGADPQDLKFEDEKTSTVIGDGCVFRECTTVNRATGVGNNVIMSNVATLAGHVIVEDRAVIGGLSAVHQFCKIGRNAMIGGMARVAQDVPPFMIVAGDPAFVSGLNSVGLARAGMAQEIRSQLKKAFRILYRSGLPLQEAVATMEQELDSSEPVEHLMRFLRNVERGIIRTRRD